VSARRERRAGHAAKTLLAFEVDGAAYALDLGIVREVVLPQPLTPLPSARHEVAGVGEHRGAIVPVVDLRACLGRPEAAVRRGARWIVVRAVGRAVALAVDSVTGPIGLDEPPSPPPRADAGGTRAVAGVASHGGRPLLLIDVLALVRDALGADTYGLPSPDGA
jgi:chemotaxis signal transduction protein